MVDNIYIKRLGIVDSTNRYARDESPALWCEAGVCDIIAITADCQTAGRGQRGNIWQSQAESNLILTLLVRPGHSLKVTEQFRLSQAVAISLHVAMKAYGIATKLKWPNDIYVGNKKLAGILIELDYSGIFIEQAIIGIGLNINQTQFPVMERTPVSMKMLSNKDFDRENVLCNVLKNFEEYYTRLINGEYEAIANEYDNLLLGYGQEHQFIDAYGTFTAVIKGIEPCGMLILTSNDGTIRKYAFKEIKMVI